jgi:hypothetical protein
MRILGLHTIALMFGVLIATCTNITHLAQNPNGPQPVKSTLESTLEARSNTSPKPPTKDTSKAKHPSLVPKKVATLRLKLP